MYGYVRGGGKMYGEIITRVTDYMNRLGKRRYTRLEVSAIIKAIYDEYLDRRKFRPELMGWYTKGKEEIYKRVVYFLHERGFTQLGVKDVMHYKKCWALEKAERKSKNEKV